MISILKASVADTLLLSDIAKRTFIESHGHSAAPEEINSYVTEKYTTDIMKEELLDTKNIYHIIYYNDRPAGFSKIIFNSPYSNSEIKNITKLERIYLLKEFYDHKLGSALFTFNIDLMKKNDQAGTWLFVWKENERAVRFYKKMGFIIIGSYDFPLSKNHTNPNHQMYLEF